ncbi:D-sedoheptulose-7-phosphate isomerase [Jiangella asiatica]|uniref:SIS domain-containing protein n=1 Tax=Jiangella asiatica TaxID=2530372 RepID=A0A4R5DL01_9ACTN|nr:SIS domain-containing protein [Jiangella asiatica]TDE12684.1 SIS domain-containing protein [Jiangella asiatica]
MPEQAVDAQSGELERQLADHVAVADGMRELLPAIRAVGSLLCDRFAAGGVLYTFGNGGSAADAQHLTGELVGHYKRDRRPLPAVTLTTDPTVMTCIANDYSFDDVFARQVTALARPGDVVAAFTTSGRSANVVAGLAAASAKNATTVLFAGGDGGPAGQHADHLLLAPSTETPRIQEMHTLALHLISELADVWAAATESTSEEPTA